MNIIERIIHITPHTTIDLMEDQTPPRFCVDQNSEKPIVLAHSSIDSVLQWVMQLRNCTLRSSQLSMSNFDILKVLGRGLYGKVMLVRAKDSLKLFALKSVHKDRLIKAHTVHTIFHERNTMLQANHPFIVKIFFAFQTNVKVYLGLEYVSGGDLYYHLQRRGKIPISEVQLYIAELSLAIDYLHSIGVIYRDLKLENVLLSRDGHIRLTDFGLAKQLGNESSTGTFCGTSEYMAPEIVNKNTYTCAIDWWGVGIIMYELLFGETPFYSINQKRMFSNIQTKQPTFPTHTNSDAQDLILKLLAKDPSKRIGFSQLRTHPFFSNLDFDEVYACHYTPAFIPNPPGIETVNVGDEFALEEPMDSYACPSSSIWQGFEGFSMNFDDESTESDVSGSLTPSVIPQSSGFE